MVIPFLYRLEESERKNKVISAIITSLIILLFLAICFFWYAMRPSYVSVGEKEIEMVSGIAEGDGGGNTLDYGDRSEGSQNVNNFQPSVANPTPGEMKAPELPHAEVVQPPATPPSDTKADKPVLAGNDDTDVTVPQKNDKDKDKKDKPLTPAKPADTKPSEPQKTTPSIPDTKSNTNTSSSGGGSNHGTGPKGSVGNTGTPNTNLLNLDGIEWGSGNGKGGDGGLNNRKVIKMTKPKYDVQEEGRLTYEFIIAPDGNVVFCKALPNRYPNLAKIGEEAIKKEWKFNKLSGSQNQKVVVTITYKLTN
ncbi:MAG: hypothetical protein K1X92_14970 [Bacteroidia bacterium]|nr:hypothetical protein [Bacteroidia bacterium]